MSNFNSRFTLALIGLWVSTVQCENQAIAIYKVELLGYIDQLPLDVVENAQGIITTHWFMKIREQKCADMNRDHVIRTVKIFYKRDHINTLSPTESPGLTKVYSIFSHVSNKSRTMNVIGYICRGDSKNGSYSFILVEKEAKGGLTVYVPELQPIKDVLEVPPITDVLKVQFTKDVPEMQPIKNVSEVQPIKDILEVQSTKDLPEMQSIKNVSEVQPIKDILEVQSTKDVLGVQFIKKE